MKTVIEVSDLRKSYGGVERLHGVSFTVRAGQVFGFLGVNGAGKTTTIEILEGYRDRDSGVVSVLGIDPRHANRSWRNRVGLVLQDSTLNPVYSVRETVTIFARYFKAPTSLDRVLHASGLFDQADERIGRLSGGQKRKVDVALGLVGDPEILFLDEPTTGLDPAARREMWSTIEGLREAGKTVFLTTHYMDEAQHLSDYIVILRAGSVVVEGSPGQLSRRLGAGTQISFELPLGVPFAQLETQINGIRRDDGVVSFESIAVQRDLAALLTWAEGAGIDLANLKVTQPSLDDVFVRLATVPNQTDGASESTVSGE